jgi:uridine kinase
MNEIQYAARPFVIAIGGPSGSGKSSVVQQTAHLLGDAITLFYDDYASVSTYPSDFGAWIRDGANPNDWKTPRFASDPVNYPPTDFEGDPRPQG